MYSTGIQMILDQKKYFSFSIRILISLLFCFHLSYIVMAQKTEMVKSKLPLEHGMIHYEFTVAEYPKATIVLIHGFCGSTFSFRYLIDSLHTHNYNTVAIDLPPFGYSTYRGGYHKLLYNDVIFATLQEIQRSDNFNTKELILLGHSMGADIITQYAASYPDDVDALIFIAPAINFNKYNSSPMFTSLLASNWFGDIVNVICNKFIIRYRTIERLVQSAYGQKCDPEAVFGYMKPLQKENFVHEFFEWNRYYSEMVNLDISGIKIPIQVCWGSKDTWINSSFAHNVNKIFPHAAFQFISGAGHCPMETHHDIVNNMLIQFLEKI